MAENIPIRTRKDARRTPPAPVAVPDAPAPPSHLSAEAQARWRAVCEEWVLDVAGLSILRGALEAWDVGQAARAAVVSEGPTFTTESGLIRQNPAVKIMLDALREYRGALRQLGLEVA